MADYRPNTAEEAAEIVAAAAGEGTPIEVLGNGSKRGLGRPVRTEHTLSLAGLSGVLDYEPAELVLTARAGTPLAEIEELLASQRQMLAFEPVPWRGLFPDGGEATLGGVVGSNLAGPRRLRAGAARDHFLGYAGCNGWGDAYRAGSKVVKNVTGYDLCKLQAGGFGTLSVLTEISVKVLPRAETERTLLLAGLADTAAMGALAAALNSPHEVSAAAHIPASLRPDKAAATLLRLEGPEGSVNYRAGVLTDMLRGQGAIHALAEAESRALWRDIAEVRPFAERPADAVWRLSLAPAASAGTLTVIGGAIHGAAWFFDWAGALAWLAVPAALPDAGAAAIRGAITGGPSGGHATLVRAPDAVRETVPPFQPQSGPLAMLARRVKESFDPRFVLNPGRMQAGL